MENQPIINIGVIGHVAHGKSTFVRNISGTKTQKHSSELKNNKTIYLGYANVKIYGCTTCNEINEPEGYSTQPKCDKCQTDNILLNHLSFIDCPGHDELMATMLNGVSMMDYVILVVSANEKFPRPQTEEHFMAAKMMKIKNLIVIQNKVDLVTRANVELQHQTIKDYLYEHGFASPIIIPFSAHQNFNRSYVLHYLAKLSAPIREIEKPVRIYISRTFDINKPGTLIDEIQGGVLGGTIMHGTLHKGETLEILPGIVVNTPDGTLKSYPIRTEINSIKTDMTPLESAIPGGLIGMQTKLDPYFAKADKLVGQIAGIPGTLPPIAHTLTIIFSHFKKEAEPLHITDVLRLNINSGTVYGIIIDKNTNIITIKLKYLVCVELDQLIAISKKSGNGYRLVGYGNIKAFE